MLNEKQEKGLELAVQRYLNKEKITIIAGYAGTGKSTLIKYIIQEIKAKDNSISDSDIVYTAFTGKACQVLLKKGNKNVSTLHKLMYKSTLLPNGTFIKKLVTSIPYKIIIVDELSMVPLEMMKTLLSFNVYVIACGDPYQLPPIDKNADNHLLDTPHIFLDEVMRQEQESEIVRMSMMIREGRSDFSEFRDGKDIKIFNKNDISIGMMMWADQVICATNNTRKHLNDEVRKYLGHGDEPEDGDKIICLRNYWDILSDNETPLVNGTIGQLIDCYDSFRYLPKYTGSKNGNKKIIYTNGNLCCGDETYSNLKMDKNQLITGESCLDQKTKYILTKNCMTHNLIPLEFTYGYAITGHRAQGSEYEKVLVVEEKFPFDREEHLRWLYTCSTRSSDKLVLIR